MEVLKHGDLYSEKTYIKKCSYCGCEFKFIGTELIPGKRWNDLRNNQYGAVECPECGMQNKIQLD